jgi:hypothetical protein
MPVHTSTVPALPHRSIPLAGAVRASSGMTPWTDREISRFQTRVVIFTRRGLTAPAAETLADRLARRDQERDDRRCCAECAELQRDGACFAARQGRIPSCSTRHAPVVDILQRCEAFKWQTA